jgi:hypothetical protein
MLAIVGSRDVNAMGANKLIAEVLEQHKPIMVISGGSKPAASAALRGLCSIDFTAAGHARALGIQVVEFLPTSWKFHGPGGFAERNMKIAEACVCLVRIASTTTTTYGSGWTADRAEELGKDVWRFVIDEKGALVNG